MVPTRGSALIAIVPAMGATASTGVEADGAALAAAAPSKSDKRRSRFEKRSEGVPAEDS